MTKKLRSIIITLSVGLIALVAYFVVDYIIQNQQADEVTKVKLTEFTASNIASLKVTLQDGQYYYITENADASSEDSTVSYKVTFNGLYEGLAYSASSAKSMMTYACSLTAQRDMGETDESEYPLYGLDNPQSVVTLTKMNGDTFNIYVGSSTNAGSSYYCRVDGSDHVYIISGAHGEMFTREPNDMRITQFSVAVSPENVASFLWRYGENKEIYVYRELEESVFNPFTKYFVSSPWANEMPINGDIFSELLNGLDVLYINDYVTPKLDGSDVDLADYGLDDPWGYYKITGTDGTVQEFSFGDYTDDDLKYYCYMLDHATNDIYTVARGRVSFLEEYKALTVTTPYIVNAYMKDIQYLTAEFDGKTSVLEMKRIYLSDEEKEELENAGETVVDYNTKVTLDGVTYDSYSMSMLYQCATGILIQGEYKGYEHEETPMLKITFQPFDADEKPCVIEYYKIDNNFCAAYINGTCDFIVSVKAVQGYIDGVQIVKDGGTPNYVV